MPRLGGEGKLVVISSAEEESSVEWEIGEDIFSPPGGRDDYLGSPHFWIGREFWWLHLRSERKRGESDPGWLGLGLSRCREGCPPRSVRFSVGIKGPRGTERSREGEFSNGDFQYSWADFCSRSEVMVQGERLMQDGVLTIVCHVKKPEAARGAFEGDAEGKNNEDNDEDNDGSKIVENVKQINEVKNTKKFSLPTRHGNVIRSLKAILAEGRRADFTLKCGGGEWPVHRAILEARSRHFETLFRGEWAGRDEARIDGVAEGAMDAVLQFVYAGEARGMSGGNACGIYAAARRFLLRDLQSLCVRYMKEEMCPEMVCGALVIAEAHGEGELKERALECFFRECSSIVDTEEWGQFKKNHPAVIAELFQEFIKRERKKKAQD